MCTDLRLMGLGARHVSARTYDWAAEVQVSVRIVPRGHRASGIEPGGTSGGGPALRWTTSFGFVGIIDSVSPAWAICDGLNEAGLSVAHLALPETRFPSQPPPAAGASSAIDLLSLGDWLLGTCATVADVRTALAGVHVWAPPVERLWPPGEARPDGLGDYDFAEHLAIHDAAGGDLVVEFADRCDGGEGRDGRPVVHDNPLGALANSPPYDLQLAHLRGTLDPGAGGEDSGILEDGEPVDATRLAAMAATADVLDLPADVSSRSRFVRAVVLAQAAMATDGEDDGTGAKGGDAVEQAIRSLGPLTIPVHRTPSGDVTRWRVVRDHDGPTYHVHDLATGARRVVHLPAVDLGAGEPEQLSSLTAG